MASDGKQGPLGFVEGNDVQVVGEYSELLMLLRC